jgi:hypothetical protein
MSHRDLVTLHKILAAFIEEQKAKYGDAWLSEKRNQEVVDQYEKITSQIVGY